MEHALDREIVRNRAPSVSVTGAFGMRINFAAAVCLLHTPHSFFFKTPSRVILLKSSLSILSSFCGQRSQMVVPKNFSCLSSLGPRGKPDFVLVESLFLRLKATHTF